MSQMHSNSLYKWLSLYILSTVYTNSKYSLVSNYTVCCYRYNIGHFKMNIYIGSNLYNIHYIKLTIIIKTARTLPPPTVIKPQLTKITPHTLINVWGKLT